MSVLPYKNVWSTLAAQISAPWHIVKVSTHAGTARMQAHHQQQQHQIEVSLARLLQTIGSRTLVKRPPPLFLPIL